MTFSLPKHNVVTGRGSTAIYLLLKHLAESAERTMELLAPVNICYAALYPALYAGWSIRFIDVSPLDGNITADAVREAFGERVPDALIAAHMYGQPMAELPEIADLCRRQGVVLVEDCACAMGATSDYPLGTMGDYTVYSTGYAKVVDLGYGGILASEVHDLDWVEPMLSALPVRSDDGELTETLFSKIYRALRSFPDGALDAAIYLALPDASRRAFIYRLDEEGERTVRRALTVADEIADAKRRLFRSCKQLWEQNWQNWGRGQSVDSEIDIEKREKRGRGQSVGFRVFPYTEGAVPWRFSFFVEPQMHKPIIDACLAAGVPISDWYPSVAPMFGDAGDYPGAQSMEASILNLPLNDDALSSTIPEVIAIVAKMEKGMRI